MNGSQIHLALTHVPVILTLTGLAILFIALIRKNPTVTRVALYIIVAAGLFAIPVYLSGESAEEVVEHLPGVSENIIETHEDAGLFALIMAIMNGIAAIIGIVLFNKPMFRKIIVPLVLVVSLVTSGVMIRTAHLGGQVRHSEIRPDFQQPAE